MCCEKDIGILQFASIEEASSSRGGVIENKTAKPKTKLHRLLIEL